MMSTHTFSLAKCLHNYLTTSRHGNEKPVAKVYCDTHFESVETQGTHRGFQYIESGWKSCRICTGT